MVFLVPIYVGELVTFRATVNAARHTSMEVGVRVETENPIRGESRHSNTAYLTMVALNARGRPAPASPPLTTTGEAQRRQREAEMRRANRLTEREQILGRRVDGGESKRSVARSVVTLLHCVRGRYFRPGSAKSHRCRPASRRSG